MMEVSNEIKEDIRKTQSDLRHAIRVHQVWVARLQEDDNNLHLRSKVKDAEKEIVAIGQTQKLVVDRLRRELELYQQRLKARNKQVNIENDNRYVAQQLRDHQIQFRSRIRTVSLLKPSVLNEIHIKSENHNDNRKESNISDSDNEAKSFNEKENSNHSESDERDKYQRKFQQLPNNVNDSRSNFANALSKVKEVFGVRKEQSTEWQAQGSDSESWPGAEPSPSPPPSPPPPRPGESVHKETFMRLIGLVTPSQKDILEMKRNERRKRSTTSTNRNDFLYGNYDMLPKRKKHNQFPYLQTYNDPPQTRSAKLRKQQSQNKSSREGSPSGSSTENKGSWGTNKPAWAATLPASLSVEPVYGSHKKVCHACGRDDVASLLVWCAGCSVWQHTGCGAGLGAVGAGVEVGGGVGVGAGGSCVACGAALGEPATPTRPAPDPDPPNRSRLYRDKMAERKSLQEKNIKLCVELRKLEVRAASLKENLDEHNAEKRQLLADQIKTQRNLQKLLDFISQFKETSISIRSTSISESGSEMSKSNEE